MIETITCPVCSEWNLSTDNFCQNCGTPLRDWRGEDVGSTVNGRSQSPVEPDLVFPARDGEVETGRHVVAYRTDIGLVHHINQDAGGAWSASRADGTQASFIVVADGVSAGRHSEEASRLVVQMLHDAVAPLLADPGVGLAELREVLLATARAANHRIATRPHHSLSSADATTLVAACCLGTEGVGVWCGDSRVYRLDSDGAESLTQDHSWAEQVVHAGLMSAIEASRDPRAHMITRWLGPPDQDDPGIESFQFQVRPGDVVMCCTDGLYGYFVPPSAATEDEMASILFSFAGDLQAGVDALVNIAIQRGGRDNITAAAIGIQERHENDTLHLKLFPSEHGEDQTLHLRFPFGNGFLSVG